MKHLEDDQKKENLDAKAGATRKGRV